MKFRLFISSILVKLFADRLEIWNAGSLPRGWTVDMLLKPHTSLPPRELIAGPTVRVSIKSLVDADVIRRIGPDKGGHWEIVK